MLSCFDTCVPVLSVTWVVKLVVPLVVGVPEITPLLRLNPAGNCPEVTAYV